MVTCDGDPVVAVEDEVGVANLVHSDRWQVFGPVERTVYALPSLFSACPRGLKGPVEVPSASHGPDDLIHLDDLRPLVDSAVRQEPSSNLIEG